MSIRYDYQGEELRAKINEACERVSDRLSLYARQTVAVRVATNNDFKTIKQHWFGVDFDWGGYPYHERTNECVFQLVLQADSSICGAVKNALTQSEGYESLTIECIEGNPDTEHPLKGKVIACFSEASLEIAKVCDVSKIYVNDPVEQTLPSYERLGFRTGCSMSMAGQTHEADLVVSNDTTLNWQAFQM